MGLWMNDYRHGNAVLVTLDGMYFEGNFHKGKLLVCIFLLCWIMFFVFFAFFIYLCT